MKKIIGIKILIVKERKERIIKRNFKYQNKKEKKIYKKNIIYIFL